MEVPVDEANFVLRILRLGGLNPGHYRMAPLVRRIPACLRTLRVGSLEEAESQLREYPERLRAALDALLIGTTSYFRDGKVFEYLRQRIVPELLKAKPQPKVWSAACSNGAELYSVAMLFAEHGSLEPGQFLGTDCRGSAILAARRAHASADFVARLAGPHGSGAALAANLRAGTRWEVADVFQSSGDEKWDMILCRNLAIYLDAASVRDLWKRLAATLVPGGVLVVGKAERVVAPGLYRQDPCIYRKA